MPSNACLAAVRVLTTCILSSGSAHLGTALSAVCESAGREFKYSSEALTEGMCFNTKGLSFTTSSVKTNEGPERPRSDSV